MPRTKVDINNPLYVPSEIARAFDYRRRTVAVWLFKGWVPGAFRTPTGHWKVPEAPLIKTLIEMGWEESEIEVRLKQIKSQ